MSKLYVKGFYPRYERCNEACKNCKNLSCQITCNKFQFNSQFKRPDSIQFSLFHHRLLASVSHACRTGRHPLSTQAQSRYWQDSSISHDLLHWLCGCRFQPSIQYIEIFNAVFLLKPYVFFSGIMMFYIYFRSRQTVSNILFLKCVIHVWSFTPPESYFYQTHVLHSGHVPWPTLRPMYKGVR